MTGVNQKRILKEYRENVHTLIRLSVIILKKEGKQQKIPERKKDRLTKQDGFYNE